MKESRQPTDKAGSTGQLLDQDGIDDGESGNRKIRNCTIGAIQIQNQKFKIETRSFPIAP
jgi:hypothetical protein